MGEHENFEGPLKWKAVRGRHQVHQARAPKEHRKQGQEEERRRLWLRGSKADGLPLHRGKCRATKVICGRVPQRGRWWRQGSKTHQILGVCLYKGHRRRNWICFTFTSVPFLFHSAMNLSCYLYPDGWDSLSKFHGTSKLMCRVLHRIAAFGGPFL